MPWPWERQSDSDKLPWQRWRTGADLQRDVFGGPAPQWFSRLADWSKSYLEAAGGRLRQAWRAPQDVTLPEYAPAAWPTQTPEDYENTPEGRAAAYEAFKAANVKPTGWGLGAMRRAGGPIGAVGQAVETAGRAIAQPASWGLGVVGELPRAPLGVLGWGAVGMHPEARDLPIKDIYPLIEAAPSLGARTMAEQLPAASRHFVDTWRTEGPAAALTRPYQGATPWAPESVETAAIRYVANAPAEERRAAAEHVAETTYSPIAQMWAEIALDPLNVLDIASTTGRAAEAAREIAKAEAEYTTARRVAELSTKLDEVLESGRAIDQVTRPPEQTGRIRALLGGDWEGFKQAINPFALTPESRAAADQADTFLITSNLLEGAGDAAQARTRLEFFRTNPTEAAKVYGSYLASNKGRRVAETLRGVNLDGVEWLTPGRAYQPQAAAMEIHERARPVLETMHGVTEPTGYRKFARGFKRLASEFYMNLNPGFAFRNAINNTVTLAYDGLLAMDTPADVDRYLQRLEILPARVRTGIGGLEELTGAGSQLPAPLRQVSEAGARLARTSWIGEEAFYKRGFVSALRRTLNQTWHAGTRVPAPPAEVYQALGPGGTADLVAAAASGANWQEIVENTRRILNPRRPGEALGLVVRYLDPEQLDYLSPGVVAHLHDRIVAAESPGQVSEAIQEARDLIVAQGDAAYRRELFDPSRTVYTEATTAEGLTDLVQGMLEDARLAGLPEDVATQWVNRIEARIRAVEDELRRAVGDLTKEAAQVGTRDAALIAYEANRQQAEMLNETRRIVDEARREAWQLVEAAPAEASAIWERYFMQATQEWERHFSEALQVVEEARGDLERLASGVPIGDLVGGDPRELAEERLARQAAIARRAGEELPELGGDFDRRLEILRARVDLAQENAWRLGFQAADQETLDILESAYRYEQDVARKWRAERDALRNEMLGKLDQLPRRGKTKEQIAEARAAVRWEYAERQDELARIRFGQQAKRWEIAEAEVRYKRLGGEVAPPQRPEIAAPTRFVRRPAPEGATAVDAAQWDLRELSRELEVMQADMASGARPHDPAALADQLDRITEARDRAIVEARRGLGDLASATHTQLRRRRNRKWTVDIYQNDRVIGSEHFDTFREAQARRDELGLALTAPADVAQEPGARIERYRDLQRRIAGAEVEIDEVRNWAREAQAQGADAARVAWDRGLGEWALEYVDTKGQRVITKRPMGRNKEMAQRAADLSKQVLERAEQAPAPAAPAAAEAAAEEVVRQHEAATRQRLQDEGIFDRADEISRQVEEATTQEVHPLDAALAAAFEQEVEAAAAYPTTLEEAADLFLGKQPESPEDWRRLSEQLQQATKEALDLASEEGLKAEIARRLYVRLDEPRYIEVGGKTKEIRKQKRAGVTESQLRREILGGMKPRDFYQYQGDVAEWYNGLATDAAIRSVGGEAPPRTPPAWLVPPPPSGIVGVAETAAGYGVGGTQTEAFRAWFGDSKVVDAAGDPLVVYHGTQAPEIFDEFSVSGPPIVEGGEYAAVSSSNDPTSYMGAHFAQEPEVAGRFAGAEPVTWLKTRYVQEGQAGGRVYPVYLSIDNPRVFNSEAELGDLVFSQDVGHLPQLDQIMWDTQYMGLGEDRFWEMYQADPEFRGEVNRIALERALGEDEPESVAELVAELGWLAREELEAAGFDGVRYPNMVEGGTSWIAFDPTQVKSATANVGRWSRTEPSILRERAPHPVYGDIATRRAQQAEKGLRTFQKVPAREFIGLVEDTGLLSAQQAAELMGQQRPEYLAAVIDYLTYKREQFLTGQLTVRDVAKAMVMNSASQRASEQRLTTFLTNMSKFGLEDLPIPDHGILWKNGEPWIRREDAAAAWLLTPNGRQALDKLDQGIVDTELWFELEQVMSSWGLPVFQYHGTFDPTSKSVNFHRLPEYVERFNQAGRQYANGEIGWRELNELTRELAGVDYQKTGFVRHFLGLGDTPTVDAVEINWWLTGRADIGQLKDKRAEVAREIVQRMGRRYMAEWMTGALMERFKEIERLVPSVTDIDPEMRNHVIHHWLWDRAKGTETTHEAMYEAMRLAEQAQTWDTPAQVAPDVQAALTRAAEAGEWPDAQGAQLSFGKYESGPGLQVALDGSKEPAYGWAKRYQTELVQRGWLDFRGQPISRQRPAHDIAHLFRIYRDPEMETLRVIYLKDGQLVSHEAFTSGMVDTVLVGDKGINRWAFEINRRADRLQADEIYLLHNHPSGSPKPSPEDVRITRELYEKAPRIKGHVVIDGEQYAFIDATLAGFGVETLTPRAYYPAMQPIKPAPLPFEAAPGPASSQLAEVLLDFVEGERITSPARVAEVGKRIHEDGVTILWLNTQLEVVGFEQRPIEWLRRPDDFWPLLSRQQRFMDAAQGAIVVNMRDEAALRAAINKYWESVTWGGERAVEVVDVLLVDEGSDLYRSMRETEGLVLGELSGYAKRPPFRRVFEPPAVSQWALDEQIKAVESARRRVDVVRERTKLEVGAAPDSAYRKALEVRTRSEQGLEAMIEQAREAGLDTTRAEGLLTERGPSQVTRARAQQGAAEFPTLAELTRHVEPRALEALDAIEAGVLSDWGQWQGRQADARTAGAVDRWLQTQVRPAFDNARLAAVTGAQRMVDRAMLDYSQKNRLDEVMSLAFPYHFWYTRSAKNWANRLARDPARLMLYIRYRRAMKQVNEQRGLRGRFEGRWRLPVPGALQAEQGGPWPEYLDPALYVDPTTWLFPFSTFDRVDWDNPEQAQNALTTLYQGMTNFGFRPYAFLEVPIQYTGQLGESREEIGDLVPQTGIIRGLSALAGEAGAQMPAGGVGIETPIRRAAGLGEQGPWDPYRVQRMLSSMAADNPATWQVALDAQELQQQVTQGSLDLKVATGEAPIDVGLEGIAQRYAWPPERLQAAQAMLRDAVQRAAVERAIPAVASFAGIPASVVATGEQRQLELQREGQAQAWTPTQPAGSRAGYEAWRDVHPEQYSRSMGYQVLPGETPADWWTPGTAANVVAAGQERDRIVAQYQQQIEEALRADITDQWTVRQLEEQRGAELDAIDARYPAPESTTQAPAARFGQTPAEYGRAVLDRELRAINETLPKYTDFANYEDYEAALDLALGSLPETNTALKMAQRSGATRALTLQEALEAWRKRYDSPLEALQKTYFDLVYWPAMDEYQRRVDAGQDKGKAWDATIGSIGPMTAAELIPEVVGSYMDQGWQTEQLRALYEGITFPAAEEAGEGRRAPDERQFWQMLELIPYNAQVRNQPTVALLLSKEARATATPEQIAAANEALTGWLAEHPEAETAARQADQLAAEIEQRWPGVRELEKEYFTLNKAERARFREEHPELMAMWDYKDQWKANHPEYVAIYDPDFEPDKAKGDGRRKAEAEREGYQKVYTPGAPWWASYRSGGGGRSSPKRYKSTWRHPPTWGRREVIRAGL